MKTPRWSDYRVTLLTAPAKEGGEPSRGFSLHTDTSAKRAKTEAIETMRRVMSPDAARRTKIVSCVKIHVYGD